MLSMTSGTPVEPLKNFEGSDEVDQQFKTMPDGLICLTSTYYLKLSKKSMDQDTEKPKLHILFDGLRFYERASVSDLDNSDFQGPRLLFLNVAASAFVFLLFYKRSSSSLQYTLLPPPSLHLAPPPPPLSVSAIVHLQSWIQWEIVLEFATDFPVRTYYISQLTIKLRDESDLVNGIVEDIWAKLSKFCPSELNGLVGIEQNIAPIHSLLLMKSKEVLLGSDEVEAMQIFVPRIKDLAMKLSTFKRLPRLRFLKFYLHMHAELFKPPNGDAYIWYPQYEFPSLLSEGCKELMTVASEIHIRFEDFLFIDDYSDPLQVKEILKSGKFGKQVAEAVLIASMISGTPIGHLKNLESEVEQVFYHLTDDDRKFQTSGSIIVWSSTYYLKLYKKKMEQDGSNTKLHILFDGFRFLERTSVSLLNDSNFQATRNKFLCTAAADYLFHIFGDERSRFQFLSSFSLSQVAGMYYFLSICFALFFLVK
ncbi:hypothetical protein VNO78_34404 [Psophocarpus tetragonolobus]|uniref:Uncharacterized protein n=1 Tax=Psophocarpus tetragonolobus TaxID=3891 RepID=A0AAN9RP96_PSOTE